jgi:IS5 family transposase
MESCIWIQFSLPSETLATAHQIHAQERHDKNKIYSVHEPEVQCIAKDKAGKQ